MQIEKGKMNTLVTTFALGINLTLTIITLYYLFNLKVVETLTYAIMAILADVPLGLVALAASKPQETDNGRKIEIPLKIRALYLLCMSALICLLLFINVILKFRWIAILFVIVTTGLIIVVLVNLDTMSEKIDNLAETLIKVNIVEDSEPEQEKQPQGNITIDDQPTTANKEEHNPPSL